jgi:predicted ATPase/DNA-binding SARP family transcriptional activator
MTWTIELLGLLRVRQGDQETTHVFTRKTGALMAYLACYSTRKHRREELMELLWPEQDPQAAQNNLRVVLTRLRREFQPSDPTAPTLILADRLYVSLHACHTDVAEFDALIQAAKGASTPETQIPPLQTAIDLYHGHLLPGFDDAWIMPERQRFADGYLWALDRLTVAAAQARDYDQALVYAHRSIAVDPLRESSHRSVMRLYAAIGRPAAALQQYRELQRLLWEELGATPTAVTQEFAAQLIARPEATLSEPTVVAVKPPSTPIPTPRLSNATRLPPHFTRTYGRAEEIVAISKLLLQATPSTESEPVYLDARLVTLTGPGGAGKTRLAREVAHNVESAFMGNLYWVPLGNCDDPCRILDAIAGALCLKHHGGDPLLQQIIATLTDQPTLLILDNFEHLLPIGGILIQRLRTAVPTLVLLITSRQRLELPGAQVIPVLPLPVPMRSTPTDQLEKFACVQLFVDRACAVRPGFRVTNKNAAAVADLCRRLEGLPLAIELAAAWAHLLTPAAMLQRLDRACDLLVSRQPDTLLRHQTMWGAIEWSYRLLSADLQRFFASLSVLRGGWTIEAAAAVCDEPYALERLRELQERSLIYCVDSVDNDPRFGMLELVREFADQQLTLPERTVCGQRHADWFLHLVEATKELLGGPDQEQTLQDMERDLENIRAALCWHGSQEGAEAAELRMVTALYRFWVVRAYMTEGREYLRSALARQRRSAPSQELARALRSAANIAMMQFDNAEAEQWLTECAAMQRALGSERGVMEALLPLAAVTMNRGDTMEAERLYIRCLEYGRETGYRHMVGCALMNLGELALGRDDLAQARVYFTESLEIYREKQDLRFVAGSLCRLGNIDALEAKPQAAAILCQEALKILRRIGDKEGLVRVLLATAQMIIAQCDYVAASHLYEEALPLVYDLRHMPHIAEVFEGLAYAVLAEGQLTLAGQLVGHAERLRQAVTSGMTPGEFRNYERRIAAAHANDPDGLFDSGRSIGATLNSKQAWELASSTIIRLTQGDTTKWGHTELQDHP